MGEKTLLQKHAEEWMQLERKTLEQRKLAEEFYETNLMNLITQAYIDHNHQKVTEKIQYLIVSVGTSYEPIVLNISLFQPKKILFLYTDITEAILDKIISVTGLKATSYEKSRVSETDPLDIYREIKRGYLNWGKPSKIFIDFTGGTKAMSAAAAMAGAMIDIQLVYVGTNDYLVDFRKPNPGSETLFYIANPLAVFGDLEIEKAIELFDKNNYAGTREKLEVLKENIPDPNLRQQMNFVFLLAGCYEAWDALDFESALKYIKQLNRELKRDRIHHNFILMDLREVFEKQEKMLEDLKIIKKLSKERKKKF